MPERDLGYPGKALTIPAGFILHHASAGGSDDAAICRLGGRRRYQPTIPLLAFEGATGLRPAFDLPTADGLPTPTIPFPRAKSASAAWPSSSLADMEVLFDKIPLANVTTSMTINSPRQ